MVQKVIRDKASDADTDDSDEEWGLRSILWPQWHSISMLLYSNTLSLWYFIILYFIMRYNMRVYVHYA